MDYSILRKSMVREQLIPRGIIDEKILEVFSKVERHKFVPEEFKANAYADHPLPIGENQTISQPYIVALMTECLNLNDVGKVLEIGTGSGYQSAILAELVREVYTIERFSVLAQKAGVLFDELGYTNIKMRTGDGTLGWQEESPFDRIIVTAAALEIPLPLVEQLKEGGRLIIPLGGSFSQILTVVEKKKGEIESSPVCGCVFVPLVGKYGQEAS
ncbi:MAG: protein-L-isoaspartate(D-aspartate) O-methyltransferase [Candidatus Omnitrophota bacterium]|nr:protein-L-isoaspartate(D-aspartate) O-methyltransferase [Candidatus Omnitrophota bacterium]